MICRAKRGVMTGALTVAAASLALVTAAGCGGSQKPAAGASPEQVDKLERRLADLELRAKKSGLREPPGGGAGGRRDRIQRKLERIDAQLEELTNKLREVEAKADARPEPPAAPPAPPPRRPSAPDPDKSYAVPLNDAAIVGPKNAWVTIVIGWDFGPFVKRVQPTLDELRDRYKGDVRLAYKTFPLWPDQTGKAVLATCAAARQGKFKQMFDAIYERGYDNGRDYSEDNLVAIAKSVKLNMRKFNRDRGSERCKKWVETHREDLARVGTRGIPSFYVNGRPLSGARPTDDFAKIIDEELAKAKASGISKRRYYRHVVKTGVKKVGDD